MSDSVKTEDVLIDCRSSGGIHIRSLSANNVSIFVRSSGSVVIETCSSSNMTAKLSSSGDLKLAGETRTLFLDVSSSGIVSAGRMRAKSAEIRLRSSGGVEAWVTDRLTPRLSGKGNLRCLGNPAVVGSKKTGAGNLIFIGK